MGWPLHFANELRIGNLQSPVGIATLWTVKDRVADSLRPDQYCVVGNLYTAVGINAMIKNILARPSIRYLILCGADLAGTAPALLDFMSKGLDADGRIADHDVFIDSNIPPEMVEAFRRGVQLIDMRGREAEIPAKVAELPGQAEPFCLPVEIPEEPPKELADLDSNLICPLLRAADICSGWLKVLDLIMKFGERKRTEYTSAQKEVLNLTVVIEGDDAKLQPWMQISERDLETYYPSVLGPEKPPGVHYAYGERLFGHPLPDGRKVDQVARAIERLRQSPHTRRAVAVTWNVALDSDVREDQPCITLVSWNVKRGKLIQTAVIRSNDMFDAWPRNAFALRRLQKLVAERVGLAAGEMAISSISAHIYEHRWRAARELVDKYYRGGLLEFRQDMSSGYFVVSVAGGQIHVQHHLLDGRPSAYRFSGTKAQDLYRRIVHENLVHAPDHLAYIGHELARAEHCLRSGTPFVQGEA